MFQDAFEKLELADVATILDQIGPLLDGAAFDPIETTILALKIPFYPGYQLLEISDNTQMPANKRFAVYSPQKCAVLDFTNKPIYDLNKDVPIRLSEKNVADYVRFFFAYVRGKHGRFVIAEAVDEINWKEDPPPAARKAVGKMITPVILLKTMKDGTYFLQATMMFKDSLFKADVEVRKDGLLTLKNEELLIEDMPVLDESLGH